MNTSADKLNVLIIEDEPMVALLVEDLLHGLGHEVAIATRMPRALYMAERGAFDVALIDLNLNGNPSYPVARLLHQRGIPFAFATGYGAQGIDPEFVGVPVLAKPFLEAELNDVLQRLCKS